MTGSGDVTTILVVGGIAVVGYLVLRGGLLSTPATPSPSGSGPVPGQTQTAYNIGVTAVTSKGGQLQANNAATQHPLVNNPSVMYNTNGTVYTDPLLQGTTYGGPQPSTQDLQERNTAV